VSSLSPGQTFFISENVEVSAKPLREYDGTGFTDEVPLNVDNITLKMSRLVAERVMNELKRALSRYPD
jgi:hypothetical protein